MSTIYSPIQYYPVDFSVLQAHAEHFSRAVRSENTWRTYEERWSTFVRWCETAGQSAMPARPETLILYVTWALTVRKNRLKTVRLTLVAVGERHRREKQPNPLNEEVRTYVDNCARHLKEAPGGKNPITLDHIRKLCEMPSATLREKRNRAIVLVGFSSGWRRGELTSLDFCDVTFEDAGVVLRLRHSKTDQKAHGRYVGIHRGRHPETCPVEALHQWIEARGTESGPLFTHVRRQEIVMNRFSGWGICRMLKRALKRLGVDDTPYSAHSLRIGFVTQAAAENSSPLAIMQHTGHRSVQTVLKYMRPAELFRLNPLADSL